MNDAEVYERWDDGFVVRKMTRDDGLRLIGWISADRTMCHELLILLDIRRDSDVDGFFVGELNGEMVATVVLTPIADDLRMLGLLYVVERLRGTGLARRMITTARDVERRRSWDGMVCLTTWGNNDAMYVKFDYKATAMMTRYKGRVSDDVDRDRRGTDVRQVTVTLVSESL